MIANHRYTMIRFVWLVARRLVSVQDPDIMVFNGYGATTNENQSRVISGGGEPEYFSMVMIDHLRRPGRRAKCA